MPPASPRRLSIALRDGIELSLVEHAPSAPAGAGAGPQTYLLVHGLASNARTWDGVAQALASAGQLAVAVDLRGHGRSSKPAGGYDVATVADDLCRLLAWMSAHETTGPVVLAGQSWGGNVVIEAAARCPQRIEAVAGVDGGAIRLAGPYPEWRRCAAELAPPRIAGMTAASMEQRLRRSHPDWPESGIVGTMANFEVRGDGTLAPWLTRERHMLILRGLWEHDPRTAYPRVTMPSLLIAAGAADRGRAAHLHERSFEEAAALLPAGELVRLPDADHDVHAQHPGPVARLLMRLAARTQVTDEG
ncbi:MAG TPA: alpha/beta hydrolase [Anaerolineae bacterium]|nr:alpha/beta hydrolase [Anaerolineae bacterium]